MDTETPWRRKRPLEDKEYLESKRFLSEHFFNMRISQPRIGASGHLGQMTSLRDIRDSDVNMSDDSAPMSSRSLPFTSESTRFPMPEDILTEQDIDEGVDDATPMSPRSTSDSSTEEGSPARTTVPFLRPASSKVDEKVDDLIRTSRRRLLADASLGRSTSITDKSRAIIPYSPSLQIRDGVSQAGGEPCPPPHSSDCGEALSVDQRETDREQHNKSCSRPKIGEQSAGTKTSEGTVVGDGTSGLAVIRMHGRNTGQRRALQPFHEEHDNAMVPDLPERDLGSHPEDTMDVAASGNEEDGIGPWQGPGESLGLTRIGTSRGAPTPELTPEWVAEARAAGASQWRGQSSNETGNDRFTEPMSTGWGCW